MLLVTPPSTYMAPSITRYGKAPGIPDDASRML
jgi:hypothetical protein